MRVLLRWPVLLTLAFAVAIGAATDLTGPVSNSQRVNDLRSFYQGEQTGMESCTGGLNDSLLAYREILSGQSTQRSLAASIAIAGSQACSPTSNGDLFDMATSVPPRSLENYGLDQANSLLYAWAYPTASRTQLELSEVLQQRAGPGSALYRRLTADLTTLAVQGREIQGMFDAAAARMHTTLAPLTPSITAASPASL